MKQLVEFLINNKSTGIIKSTNEFVDLGLKSGTLWSKYAFGSTSEEEYSKFYQIACDDPITNPKHDLFKDYKYNTEHRDWAGKNDYYYNILNTIYDDFNWNDPRLPLKYDTVNRANKNEHMPTDKQCEELCKDTEVEYIVNYNRSGINGFVFSSKVYPEAYIFMPASGQMWNEKIQKQGYEVSLWTSSLIEGSDNDMAAMSFSLYNNDTSGDAEEELLFYGKTIWRVKDKK